jgi:hypothetical protein
MGMTSKSVDWDIADTDLEHVERIVVNQIEPAILARVKPIFSAHGASFTLYPVLTSCFPVSELLSD